MTTVAAGIDVSRKSPDIHINGRDDTATNDTDGFRRAARILRAGGAERVVMEATGRMHRGVARSLHDRGFRVVVVNPRQCRDLPRPGGELGRTDRVDARVPAALSAAFPDMAPTAPADVTVDRLRDMLVMREAPVDRRTELKAVLGEVGDPDPDGPIPRALDAGVAVLHRISMGEAAERMQAAALMPGGDIGISLVAQAGIRAVASDVAVMSGYLSMSVPFLAAALAYGLSKATVLATSVLAVGQDAASAAAHEGTTGNLSLANTGYDTHRFATLEGRQIRTSAHVDTDRYTGYAPAGAGMTVTGDGTVVADAGAATSRVPAAGVRLSESLATSHETRAAEARSLSRHWSAEASQARNAAVTDATALMERYSHDVSTGEAYARGVTESESAQVQALEAHYDRMSETAGLTKNQTAALVGAAKVGGGWDFIVKLGADGSASWRGQTIERESWDAVKDYAESHQVTDVWSGVSEASRRYSTAAGESEAASLDESLSANLSRMRSFQERASLARQESESWSEQAAQVRSDAQGIERELGQPFFAWLSERAGTDGRPIGAAGAMRIASPQSPEDAETLREHAAAFIAERFPAPAGPDPATVGGAAEYEGAAGELRGAYARETAAAYGGWSEGVRDRAYVAGAPISGEVEAAALGERAETKTDQIMKETAREARTGIAREDAREGRAGVAAETNRPFEEHATQNLPVVGDWLAGKLYGTAKNGAPEDRDRPARAEPDWRD